MMITENYEGVIMVPQVAIMVIGFLLIWLPYACVSLLETVGKIILHCTTTS